MKNLIILFAILFSISLKAQPTSQLFQSSDGKILGAKKYGNIEGSPYLFNEWNKGTFKTASGKTMNSADLKYDIAEDLLVFKGTDNEPMFLSEKVTSFTIESPNGPRNFVNGFSKNDKINEKSYLEEIESGKLSLYKRYVVSIIDSKGYGSNAVSHLFNQNVNYYVLKDKNLTKFTPTKNNVIALNLAKENEISAYIKAEKIDFKKDSDLKKLFGYLNKF